MNITSPRISSLIALLIVFIYSGIVYSINDLRFEFELIIILFMSTFVGIAAFNFALRELKETYGVLSAFDLGFKKLFAILIFSLLIIIGYDTLILTMIQFFNSGTVNPETKYILKFMFYIDIFYLFLFPLFQLIILAMPGEQSSIPSEFVIEKFVEKIIKKLKSPIITALLLYGIFFIVPTLFLMKMLDLNWVIAIMLWSLLPSLVSIAALTGSGFGEDLIRLRMVRNPRDLGRLGWPKISIRELKFEIGGVFLILIALQALITSLVFGIRTLLFAMGILTISGEFGFAALLLTLFNKSRGSTKEIKEVWSESGFKVNIYQFFLPIFVFMGVVLSSLLEIFITQDLGYAEDILSDIGLSEHLGLTAIFLMMQNFTLIITALMVLKKTPESAERRLIKEIPHVYLKSDGTPDMDGYLFLYKKLKSDGAIENFLKELTKMFSHDATHGELIKDVLKQTFMRGEHVQIAAAETLYTIIRRMDKPDDDYLELSKLALHSEFSGCRIYGVRCVGKLLFIYEGLEKEELIKILAKIISEGGDVEAWDSGLALQRLIINQPQYRTFVLSFMIRILLETDNEASVNSITRFFNRITRESEDIGHMLIATLGAYISQVNKDQFKNVIRGVRSILRSNPSLGSDLIDQVVIGINNSNIEYRINSYQLLENLAEFNINLDEEILHYTLTGTKDKSEQIQEISYKTLVKIIRMAPDKIDYIFTVIREQFDTLNLAPIISTLEVLREIALNAPYLSTDIFNLITKNISSNIDAVKTDKIEILGILSEENPDLIDQIYEIIEKFTDDPSEMTRQAAITTLGIIAQNSQKYARVIYRKLKVARHDESYMVQIAAIEALGHVAALNIEFSEEIFESLKPLLSDDSWQVRLAAFNGLFASFKNRKDLLEEMISYINKILFDNVAVVREAGLEAVAFILDTSRSAADVICKNIQKNINSANNTVKATLYETLELIAERRVSLLVTIITIMYNAFEIEDSHTRSKALNTLKAVMNKLSKSRKAPPGIHKPLNKLVTFLLKAANNSNAGIRHTAYSAITIICVAVPSYKIANRGRKALETAQKNEKDVQLLDLLDKSIKRTKMPLEL